MSLRKKKISEEDLQIEAEAEAAALAAEDSVDEKLEELAEKLREGMGPHEFERLFAKVWTEDSRPEAVKMASRANALAAASGSGSGRRGSTKAR